MKRAAEISVSSAKLAATATVTACAASTALEPNPEAMTALVASELHQLSLEERQTVYEDLHGIATIRKESPEMIAKLITDLLEEVSRIRNKSAFDQAFFLSPAHVEDPKFCLMFLRAEDYNVRLAAQRMVLYFTHKQELFGTEKLAKQITWYDLSEDDRAAVITGGAQNLDGKDRSGRQVSMIFQHLFKYKHAMNQIRAFWYMAMSATQCNDEIQKNGYVCVVYSIGHKLNHRLVFDLALKGAFMTKVLPVKLRGFHFCYDNFMIRPVIAAYQMSVGKVVRLRFRSHYGSHWDSLYALHSFGIHATTLPFDTNGRIQQEKFLVRLEAQKNEEGDRQSAQALSTIRDGDGKKLIVLPSPNDVLLGRGRPYQEYSGNVVFADLIYQYRDQYQSKSKLKKTALSNMIIDLIKAKGGRFLRKSKSGKAWVEVPDEAAREKVSHSFRTKTKQNTAATTTATATSSSSDDPKQQATSSSVLSRAANLSSSGYKKQKTSVVLVESETVKSKSTV